MKLFCRTSRRVSFELFAICLAWIGAVVSTQAIAQSEAAKPIRIGVTAAIQEQNGLDLIEAAKMAAEKINATGGILGRKLELSIVDETTKPEQAIAAVRKLVEEKVDVIIGGYISGNTLAQLPHISSGRIIYLGTAAASIAITNKVKDDYANYKYVFRVGPGSSVAQYKQIENFAVSFVMGELGFKSLAIVGDNTRYAQDILKPLSEAVKTAGAELKMFELFDSQISDFGPLLAKIKNSGAKYAVTVLNSGQSDIFVKQWYDARSPFMFGGSHTRSQSEDFFQRVDGKSVSEIVANSIMRVALTPKTIPFWDEFVQRSKHVPSYSAAHTMDAFSVYAEAVKRAGTTETEAVIKQLERTDIEGVAGRIAFDEQHDAKTGDGFQEVVFAQWQDGGKRAVLWPKRFRDGEFVRPQWLRKD